MVGTSTNRHINNKANNSINVEECLAENMTFAAILKSKYIKVFVSIIKALNFINNTELKLSTNGIKYVVEESKSFQTIAYFRREFFSIYRLKIKGREQEELSFGVNLKNLCELLCALFDDDMSNMKIVYYHEKNCMLFTCEQSETGEKLHVRGKHMNDENDDDDGEVIQPVTTEYFIRTMESFEPVDLNENGTKLSSLIFSSDDFFSSLADFHKSTEEIEISINEHELKIKSLAALQMEQTTKIPNNDEIFSRFDCEKPSKFVYKFAYFKVIMKSLCLSTKTSFQTFSDGLLKIQLMVRCDEDNSECSAFIEFNMLANYEDENDEPGDE